MESKNTHHFKAHDLPPTHQLHPKARSTNSWWIIVICVVFLGFLVWNKWTPLSEFLGMGSGSGAVSSEFVVGQQIAIEGLLGQDGDFITHTHTLTTQSSGVFGLKSKTINLNQYTGMISVEGVVDTVLEGIVIVEVFKIVDQNIAVTGAVQTGVQSTGEITQQGVYLAKAGVYFVPGFDQDYQLQNSGEKGDIKIFHLSSKQNIVVSYFACKKGDPNKDCAQLKDNFAGIAEKTFTTVNGDVFYKLPEVQSWFFTNLGQFGYFINNVSEQEVVALSNYLLLPTTDYVKNTLVPQLSSLCKDATGAMTTATKSNLYLEKSVLVAKISGTWDKGTAECKIQLDPSSSTLGTVLQYTSKETTPSVQAASSGAAVAAPVQVAASSSSSLTVDAGVKQFAITPDKTSEFPSKRGHVIIFPSKRISYQSQNISNDFGVKGLHCYIETDVIDYTNKALLTTNPTLKIYECTTKNGAVVPSDYVTTTLPDGRVFMVEAVDPAWVDFANNVKVEAR